ncbi:cupin domain-containing protein [Halosolutus gelatinilyticus]|uniref:cupin domain-containing protein n=1 Tax=Halosolutus gelatinilyticus TaxID=2931975 RepID=UPI001FF506A1|nr:cupin domain-containing protein [Halosolutus gelatinilyticus]
MDHVRAADAELEEVTTGVYLGDLSTGDRASMKYWRIEPGATLPTHSHEHEQIGYVLRGALTAIVDGQEVRLEEGDAYRFPSGQRHGAENRGDEPAIGLGVLAPPRTEPDWRE